MAFSGFAGLKKQFNKANQFMNEKIGGVEGTKLDHDFFEMEAKTDVMCELVDDLQIKTKEFLHPNPASRAKMSAVKGIGKLSGQAKASTYPQPEGVLGEAMVGHGKKLGEESYYGMALIETGESMKQIADIKYNLDDNMKMNFLEPLHTLSTKDIKEVQHHRKKLQGRRLDFDCKKRKKDKALSTSPSGSPARSPGWGAGSHVTDEEIKMAEDKFAESLQLAQMGMHNLLENDVEQISQLATFADNLLDYHKQCCEILDVLVSTLNEKKDEAATRPKQDFVPKTLSDLGVADTLNGGLPSTNVSASPLPSPMKSPARSPMLQTPSAVALYDFEPENPGELGFSEGDNITLTQRIDENWFEGSLNGKTGLFPVSYVNVTVPLP
ncbi:endophilin-A-like isoform X10 [Portunus trituberculatus]|uniref:endophilin-A-like isoform X10 n=1 Tax=Portunus trituberculatus TaxID=210409 RepID=UPI001E1CB3FF|nr:endophilin-A-like isoform X10 [Portunus trituberculatus]